MDDQLDDEEEADDERLYQEAYENEELEGAEGADEAEEGGEESEGL